MSMEIVDVNREWWVVENGIIVHKVLRRQDAEAWVKKALETRKAFQDPHWVDVWTRVNAEYKGENPTRT